MRNRKLRVFLLHASEDKPVIRELYQQLKKETWIEPWLDEENILVGQVLVSTIDEAMESADAIIACFSSTSVKKGGFVQKELRYALKIAEREPPGTIFLLPIRLDPCEVPRDWLTWAYRDYFSEKKEKSYEILLESLAVRKVEVESREESRTFTEEEQKQRQYSNFLKLPKLAERGSQVAQINSGISEVLRELHKTQRRREPVLFVGRNRELRKIHALLDNPFGERRIVYLEGTGGIGKTRLILEVLGTILDERNEDFLVPSYISETGEFKPQLIDFYSVANRTIEGVTEAIIQYLGEEYFKELHQSKNKPIVFRQTLITLVKRKPVILAFDALELVHNDRLLNWLLDDSEFGLQIPGLICLIGSRPIESQKRENIKRKPLAELIELSGITYENAIEFYCQQAGLDVGELNLEERGFIKELVSKTDGNPLLIELVFDQSRGESEFWTQENIKRISLEELKKAIMQDVRENFFYSNQLIVHERRLHTAEFDTLLCMSYLIRRFDPDILDRIVKLGFIKLDKGDDIQSIIDTLRPLFFVKVRENNTLQLHDELARIVRQYLFNNFGDDILPDRNREFQKTIPELYNRLILDEQKKEQSEEIKLKIAQLQAERLYYLLEYGLTILKDANSGEELKKAYDYFVELQESENEQLYELLPGEMLRVIDYYPENLQLDIYRRLFHLLNH
jgi:hypothetical protein